MVAQDTGSLCSEGSEAASVSDQKVGTLFWLSHHVVAS